MDKGTILILPFYKNLEGTFCHLIPSTVSSNQVASSQYLCTVYFVFQSLTIPFAYLSKIMFLLVILSNTPLVISVLYFL